MILFVGSHYSYLQLIRVYSLIIETGMSFNW